ncbi:MAG: hypothetical protein IJP34_02050 [Clostridia bacterium]|nr:hypothetical protein [Clostridia bacterium]
MTKEISIKINAKACNKSMSTYIREIALNSNVINFDYPEIEAHTQEIRAKRENTDRMIYTILRTGEYAPADFEYILKQIKYIYYNEKRLVEKPPMIKEEKSQQFATEARKIVRNYISKNQCIVLKGFFSERKYSKNLKVSVFVFAFSFCGFTVCGKTI